MSTSRRKAFLPLILAAFLGQAAHSAAVYPPGFSEKVAAKGLTSPTSMAFTLDGRVFVTQQMGAVAVVVNDSLLPAPLLQLGSVDFNTERGLMGIAVDPGFAANHWVYLYYTRLTPTSHNRLSRFTVTGNTADSAQETVLIDFPELPKIASVKSINVPGNTTQAVWHMGGSLAFAPDGKLFVGVGEHQQPDSAQKLGNIYGKILRFNSDGTIPADNPFYDAGTGLAKAIWAYGMRNPWTLAVDPGTGRLFAGDIGDRTWEEVDEIVKGKNYGWKLAEGASTNAAYTNPLFTYKHTEGCAVMGGAFSAGQYYFGDFCKGWIRQLDPATGTAKEFASGILFPTGVKVSPSGAVYYLVRGHATGAIKPGAGQLVKVYDPTSAARPRLAAAPGLAGAGWVVNLDGGATLRVPGGMTRLRCYDADGTLAWETGGLRDGLVRLSGAPRGALRYRWLP